METPADQTPADETPAPVPAIKSLNVDKDPLDEIPSEEGLLTTEVGGESSLLRDWNHKYPDNKVSPKKGQSESEFEHSFEAGDHVIRWSHVALYPIQIHGIIISTTPSCVTLCDFGLTSAGTNNKNGEKESEEAFKAAWEKMTKMGPKQKNRLNVITITEKENIHRWKKVNYGSSLASLGKFDGTMDKWKTWWNKSSGSETQSNTIKPSDNLFPTELPTDSSISRSQKDENTQELFPVGIPKQNQWDWYETPPPSCTISEEDVDLEEDELPIEKRTESEKTLTDLIAEANAVERKVRVSTRTSSTLTKSSAKSMKPSWSWSSSKPNAQSLPSTEKQTNAPKLPKSDPSKLVLARVQFLLSNEADIPAYHVFYSNSECIAVWCKTGTWSTLQTAIFLHSTAIGNAKSTFLLLSGMAAVQPWLIPALAPVGIACVGGPWLYLSKCKDKWEVYTQNLTDLFWAQAEPEVFVEVINHWSRLY